MNQFHYSLDAPMGRVLTLNELRSQQCSLNMQVLLAVQLHDLPQQQRLEQQLAELQDVIARFLRRAQ